MYYQHEDKERLKLSNTWRKLEESEDLGLKTETLMKFYEKLYSSFEPTVLVSEEELANHYHSQEKAFYEGFFGDLVSSARAGLQAAGQDWKNSKEKKTVAGVMKHLDKIFSQQKQKLSKTIPALHKIYDERVDALTQIQIELEKTGDKNLIDTVKKHLDRANKIRQTLSQQYDDAINMQNLDKVADKIDSGEMPSSEDEKEVKNTSDSSNETGESGDSSSSEPQNTKQKIEKAADTFKQDKKQFEQTFFSWIKNNKDSLEDIIGSSEGENSNGGDDKANKLSSILQQDPGAGKLSKEVNDLIAKSAIEGKSAEEIRAEIKNKNSNFKVTDDVRHAIGKALGEVGREEDTSKLKESIKFKNFYKGVIFEGVAEDLITHYENNHSFIKGIQKLIGKEPDQKTIANLISKFVDSDDYKNSFGTENKNTEVSDAIKNNPTANKIAKAAKNADGSEELIDIAANQKLADVLQKSGADGETVSAVEDGAVEAAKEKIIEDPSVVAKAAVSALQEVGPEELEQKIKQMQKNAPKGLFGKLNSLVDAGLNKVGIKDKKTQKILKIGAIAVLGAAAVAAIASTGGVGGAIGAAAARKASKMLSGSLYNEINGFPTTAINWSDGDGDGIIDPGEVTGYDRDGLGWMNGLSWNQVKSAVYGD
jgi:hypothetical protein